MSEAVIDSGEVRTILGEELTNLAERIKVNHQAAKQVASGRTLRSIKAEVISAEGFMAEGVVSGRSPFGTLETGRRGGRVPANFQQVILDWMADKGIQGTPKGNQKQETANRSLAWCIARKIAKSGTKLYREGGRADIYSSEIPNTVNRITERMGTLVLTSVDKMIKLNTK